MLIHEKINSRCSNFNLDLRNSPLVGSDEAP
jgi:hypothetical protein